MRKLRIFEHISLDGVIQLSGSGEGNDFAYGDPLGQFDSHIDAD